VRAYLTVIDRNPEAVEKVLMNKSSDAKGIEHDKSPRRTVLTAATRWSPLEE
jgi:hypothetical protein